MINAGESGETTHGFPEHTERSLKQFCPDVVFINFGINDGDCYGDTNQFCSELTAIVREVRGGNSLALTAKPFRAHFDALFAR